MSDTDSASPTSQPPPKSEPPREFLVGSAPHMALGRSTPSVMFDVVLAMVPLLIAAIVLYRGWAVILTITTVAACLLTEAIFNACRKQSQSSLLDGSAIVTGMILAFSLPPKLPLYMAVIGGVVAIGLGKAVFGGLGQNLFNPAMVGRAFLMACFPVAMTTWAQPGDLATVGSVDAVTKATPLAAAKFGSDVVPITKDLFLGNVSGSLGEASALACLIGGIYLLLRGTANWRAPLGMLVAVVLFAGIAHQLAPDRYQGVLFYLNSGALMFGMFFIVTDYVGAPLTPIGRLLFGFGAGILVMIIRLFGGYPEGVMYSVLIMNALTPLIERWTVPEPFGGKVAAA
ncbi:MAG: RnfABCDGE type electron transport complex subunit D [Planctomycetota bacterium]|nr:MAG: RnfABCDGE type electron transport complex subunit D [Planctomycetota bacterium]